MKILPSLKEKKRYLIYEVISDNKINVKDAFNEILNSYSKFFGELGLAKAGLQFVDEVNNNGIIRVDSKCVDELKSSLILVKEVNGKKVIIETKGVSGILKKGKEKFGG